MYDCLVNACKPTLKCCVSDKLGVEAKRLFCCFLSIIWVRLRKWRMEGVEKKKAGAWGYSIRWDKSRFDLQHSFHPCWVAFCAPLLLFSPFFLLPSSRRISELGFPRLLSEEAIMMFWNTKAFHAQISTWFGVKERAGLPARLALPLSFWPSSFLLSFPFSSATSLPSKTWQCQQQLGLSTVPTPAPSLSFFLFLPLSLPLLFSLHILRLWAVLPAVSIVQCLTSEGEGCSLVCSGGSIPSLVQSSSLLSWCKPHVPKKLSLLWKILMETEVPIGQVTECYWFSLIGGYVSFLGTIYLFIYLCKILWLSWSLLLKF